RRSDYPLFADRPPELWEFFLTRSNAHSIAAVAHRAMMVHRLDLRPILPAIRQPVLLVGGDRDPVVSRACEDELGAALPNARRVELMHCGHNPLFTHPEVLAELARQVLTPPGANHAPSCSRAHEEGRRSPDPVIRSVNGRP